MKAFGDVWGEPLSHSGRSLTTPSFASSLNSRPLSNSRASSLSSWSFVRRRLSRAVSARGAVHCSRPDTVGGWGIWAGRSKYLGSEECCHRIKGLQVTAASLTARQGAAPLGHHTPLSTGHLPTHEHHTSNSFSPDGWTGGGAYWMTLVTSSENFAAISLIFSA